MKIKDIEKLELDAKQCLNTTHYAKEIAKVYIGESEDNLEVIKLSCIKNNIWQIHDTFTMTCLTNSVYSSSSKYYKL